MTSKLSTLLSEKNLSEIAIERKRQYFIQKIYDFCLTLYIDNEKKDQKTFDLSEPVFGVGGVNFGPPTKKMVDEVVSTLSKKYSCKVDPHYKIMIVSINTISYDFIS